MNLQNMQNTDIAAIKCIIYEIILSDLNIINQQLSTINNNILNPSVGEFITNEGHKFITSMNGADRVNMVIDEFDIFFKSMITLYQSQIKKRIYERFGIVDNPIDFILHNSRLLYKVECIINNQPVIVIFDLL